MIKKVLLAAIGVFILALPSLAQNTLRNPQGRIGTQYKTEKFVPPAASEITQKENKTTSLTNNGSSKETKYSEKSEKNQAAQKAKELKDIQRQHLAQKKQEELKKQQEQKEQLLSQKAEEKKLLAEQKKIDAQKKRAEKKAAEEAKTETIISHKKEYVEKKEAKLNFKIGRKHKNAEDERNLKAETTQNTDTTDVSLIQQPTEPTETNKKHVQDTDTKNIVNEIKEELETNRPEMLRELSTLWVSAVQKSDTVYFAIMKLSNPNGEEVNKNGFKKIMEPIIGAAPLVGQAFVNPALTAGSIIGSNVMGTMMNDSAKHRLAKVNDADLVILARAIDELQESLLMNYMAYKGAKKEYELAVRIADDRKKEYEEMNKKNSPNTILANTFYTEALDNQYKMRQEFLMRRVVLEQMVGSDALNEIENPKTEEPQPQEENQQ